MLFPYLIKVSFLLAVLTLSYRWLVQYETFSKTNRFLLIFNVLAAWSLPLIPLSDWGPVEVQKEFHQTVPKIISSVPMSAAKLHPAGLAQTTIIQEHATNWQLVDWLTLIYFAGMALMLIIFLFQIIRLFLSLLKYPSQTLENGITLIQDPTAESPYSFLRWVVCNPDKRSDRELQHIFAHESEHVRQLHSLDLMLAETQRIILWFNPFAWFHRKLVQGNLEYLADKAVLEKGFEKKQYQFNLLKVLLRTNELPLTNSFAQSLLKKRIKMMNRKPSKFWVSGKYALLIVLLYLSTAFVAPYSRKIISLAPVTLKPIVKAFAEENAKVTPATEIENVPSKSIETSLLPQKDNKAPDPKKKGKSNWVLIKNDTLYWAISPMTTWDEINLIRDDINSFGATMQINTIKYDPLQLFISELSVHIYSKGSSGSGSRGDDLFAPMSGYSGYILKTGLGMGQIPPAPLNEEMKKDYQKAVSIQKDNELKFFEYKFTKELGAPASSTGYSKRSLEAKFGGQTFSKSGLGKSSSNTLLVTELLEGASFYLNAKPSSRSELNSLDFEKFVDAKIIEDRDGKKYVLVQAK